MAMSDVSDVDIPSPEVSPYCFDCRYCVDFNPDSELSGMDIPLHEWLPGISASSCRTCRILFQGLEKLYPTFLTDLDDIMNEKSGVVSVSPMHASRVYIDILQPKQRDWCRVAEVQFYNSLVDTEVSIPAHIPHIVSAGDISPVAGDEQMWSFLKKCLTDCRHGHDKCTAAQDTNWYPQRLIKLTRDEAHKPNLRLIQGKDKEPSSPYIALSHCWGSSSPFSTTKGNTSELSEHISFFDLPRTFQDCVTTAHALDVQYIWIDSLCIVQDDRQDWARHAQCMDKIYENALFTVAAVSSPSGNVPFLGNEAPNNRDWWQSVVIDIPTEDRKSESVEQSSFEVPLRARKFKVCTLDVLHGPLENRGWTWQERYLSTRIINFTNTKLRWDCKTAHVCECVAGPGTDLDLEDREPSFIEWQKLVTQYSRRELTYATDRLPALSGAASRFHHVLKSEYIAGLWTGDFPRNLAWFHTYKTQKADLLCALDNGVPSWSWASVAGEVEWLWDHSYSMGVDAPLAIESQVELVTTNCRPSSDNIFGEVDKGSFLKIRGKVVEAEILYDRDGHASVQRKKFGKQWVDLSCVITSSNSEVDSNVSPEARSITMLNPARQAAKADVPGDSLLPESKSKGLVYCLLLFTAESGGTSSRVCSLILGKGTVDSDTYQRLGLGITGYGDWNAPMNPFNSMREEWNDWKDAEDWRCWEEWFADAEVKTLTIV